MILVDLIVIAIFAYAAYVGTQRGLVLISLELLSLVVATVVSLLAYHPLGGVIKSLAGISLALGDLVAFALIWIITEILMAVIVRLTVLRRLPHGVHATRFNRIGGSVLNTVKSVISVALGLVIIAGLPLSSGTKRVVTDAAVPKFMLASSGMLQSWVAGTIGHDLNQGLDFFTVTAEPESEQRIELGYTTVGTIDPQDEDAMLTMLNHERTTRGLKPLAMNSKARTVARAYSAEMFAKGYFSHVDPSGKSPFDRMRAAHITFGAAGENLALAPTLQLAHKGLMNSPGHRANILSPNYHTVGIGIIDGGPYGLMITQDFTD
ncbi:MAG TPA: CvpA family protein [Candidatus Saccharimonadia bacterium]